MPFPERLRIIDGLIKPRYALLRAEHSLGIRRLAMIELLNRHRCVDRRRPTRSSARLARIARTASTPNARVPPTTLERIGIVLLLAEAARDLPLRRHRASRRPLETTDARRLAVQPVIVPILRAGLGFVHAAQELLPDADVGFVGISRDEATFSPKPYVNQLPERLEPGDP
ncbi:MAG: uracil phosphoribosyltransferase [Ilumatobacteraceae bacterium]